MKKLERLPEFLLTSLVGWLPTILLGSQVRTLTYRLIFPQFPWKVFIEHNVDFFGTNYIKIGKNAYIFKGARLDARGHNRNKLILGDGVAIERNVEIGFLDNTKIHIDRETFIGPGVCIGGPGNITIGKRCLIAAHTGIVANNHNFSDLSQAIKDQGLTCKGIVIEDDCWLGHGVTVLDGVTIGKGSVIGAGSVVTKSIPPFSVAVGVPARVIKNRKPQEVGVGID
jgi:galactoside O-acetyltransferase